LRPDEAVEFDPLRPAVEVAREVEREDFELHRGLVAGGPDAEAGHAIAGLPVDDGPHGIDAEFRDLEIAQGDIRGRETQLPATLVAMLDSPDDFPGPAENAVGAGNIARLQQPAHARRGIGLAVAVRGDHRDADAMLRAERTQHVGIAGPGLAEGEIETDHDMAQAKIA